MESMGIKEKIKFIESIISNDEVSTNEELTKLFKDNYIEQNLIDCALSQRDEALRTINYKLHF